METWEKLSFLGEGSFGRVFLASPANACYRDRSIAVKSAHIGDELSRNCLQVEAGFLEELNGEPNIVRCFGEDWSVENGQETYNLLLEFANGGTLSHLIRNSPPMDAARVAYFARMLLTGISRIHARGIVHCDLKPGNILAFGSSENPRLKIADFGQARRVSEKEEVDEWEKYRNRGSTYYASPESVAWGEHGTCTDIWSLGIIVAEMLPGTCVWDEHETLYDQIMVQPLQLQVPCRFDEDGGADFLEKWDAVDFLQKCLDREPKNRWSAQDLLKHPFIAGNLSRHSFETDDDEMIKAEKNPISESSEWWVAVSGLFTDKTDDMVL